MGPVRTINGTGIRRLDIQLGSGNVRLQASEDGNVYGEIRCEDADLEQRINTTTFGDTLRIDTTRAANFPRIFDKSIDISLSVPAGTHLDLTGGSCEVNTDVTLGTVSVKVGSGDLRIARADQLICKTGSGDVFVLETAGNAQLITGSGDLRLDRCGGELQATTASGDVVIGELSGSASIKSASGDITIAGASGSADVKTSSGDVEIGVAGDLPAWLDLRSGSGEVDIKIPPSNQPEPGAPFVSISARSGSGDITIVRA